MKNKIALLLILCCGLGAPVARAALHDGLVSYWPLDSTPDGATTPDIASNSNHLSLVNMTSANFVTGVRGNAASFDGASQLLNAQYTAGTDIGLPAYNARYYTITMWVRDRKYATGTNQQTRAVFAEASTLGNNPLFALRTDTASANRTNLLSAIIRNDNNNTFFGNTGSHQDQGKSTLMPFDGSWHHIAWVDNNGTARLYVDGQLDPRVYDKTRLVEPQDIAAANRGLTLNTISIGGIQQGAAGSYFNGLVDDVAVWERALTQAEIDEVRTNGIPTPVSTAAVTIANQPEGSTNLLVGENFSIQALALGTHPRTHYQWYKGGVLLPDLVETNELGEITNAPITGTTNSILIFTNLQTAYSGAYSVVISNNYGSVTSSIATLLVSTVSPQAPNLTNGQIAYWPLDTVQGVTTPDVVRGQDMFLYNLSAANLASGRWGNAMKFNTNGMLSRFNSSADALPVNKYHDFTISAWINSPGYNVGGGGTRIYTECRLDNTQPTFSLACGDTAATPRGPATKARAFLRNDNNQNNADAGCSALDAFYDSAVTNSTWHHIVYRQRWVGGARPMVEANWFIDGVKDPIVIQDVITQNPHSPRVSISAQNTSIGGQWRGGNDLNPLTTSGRSFPFAGLIDDVAVWNRALTAEEIVMLSTNVVPAAPPVLPAFVINSFRGDFAQVVSGGSLVLSWNVAGLSGPGLALSVDQGIGSVLSLTTNGIGRVVVPNITSSKTFTLTAQRETTNVLTAQTSVSVVNGIAAGWNILDNFQSYSAGALLNPYWTDFSGNCTVEDIGGNHMLHVPLTASTDGAGAALSLASYTINQGQARTLFARIYVQDDPALTTMGNVLGVTDKTMRTGGADTVGDIGPIARLNNDPNGHLALGAINDVAGAVTLIPCKLEFQQVYNLWIDVTNGSFFTNEVTSIPNTGDSFSIWLQREGAVGRLLIVSNYMTDRDLVSDFLGATLTTLDKFVTTTRSSSGTVYVDDVFISQSGYNSSVPVPWAGPTPPALAVPNFTPTIIPATEFTPMQIQFDWSAGALMSAPTITGPWTVVADSFGFSYLWTIDPADPQRFFVILR